MIDWLIPGAAAGAERRGEPAEAFLFPAEEQVLGPAGAARRRQFATARECARVALGRLGVAPTAILRGEHREPLWPEGVVGSITHCRRYTAGAVARSIDVASLGIDAEPNEPLPAGLLERVMLPAERLRVAVAEGADGACTSGRAAGVAARGICFDRLLFSAKEAVYKAWFPLTGHGLGFHDVEVSLGPPGPPPHAAASAASPVRAGALAGELRARLLAPGTPAVVEGEPQELNGRWGLEDGVLAVAVTVAA